MKKKGSICMRNSTGKRVHVMVAVWIPPSDDCTVDLGCQREPPSESVIKRVRSQELIEFQ